MLPVETEKLHSFYKTCNYVISTDSRNILPGSLFFCLKGPTFNGNDFAAEALEKGAKWVVADETRNWTSDKILFVDDCLVALQNLAAYHRRQIKTHILAIGGSNGKTTTKELCLHVLQSHFNVKATRANFNNHIGVPLTILSLTGIEEVAVIELGTNHPGEMKLLCEITSADSGIITNIGKEHLEGFGSVEAVAKEESELYLNLIKTQGQAFVNTDDPWLSNMSSRLPEKFTYGLYDEANPGKSDLSAGIINAMPFLEFNLNFQGNSHGPFTAKIGGAYNIYNILAAVSFGIKMGIHVVTAAQNACNYIPQNNRSEWKTVNGKQVWLDAYNANPSSVSSALESFSELQGSKAVFLGDMLELGNHSEKEHKEIVDMALQLGFNECYFAGSEFFKQQRNEGLFFKNTDDLLSFISTNPSKTDFILIKGSRGMAMERLLDNLA